MVINKNNVDYNICGFLFSRIGDCYLKIALNWNKADQFVNELETTEDYDCKVRNALDNECGCEHCTLEGNVYYILLLIAIIESWSNDSFILCYCRIQINS